MTDDADDTIDLEELVGNVLDSRGLTKERIESIDGLAGLGDKIADLFKANQGSSNSGKAFDEGAFLKQITDLVDSKISGVSTSKTPPLKRWLGLA